VTAPELLADDVRTREGIPVVRAFRDEAGFLEFHCPWCRGIHHHGRPEGPRASHCRAPGAPPQYFLEVVP
jgi:hypothetical protein